MERSAEWPPLPATEIAGKSWYFLKSHLNAFATVAAVPFGLILLLDFVSLAATNAEFYADLVTSARSLLHIAPWTLFGVAWHRLILAGEAASVSTAWTSNHTRFALFLIAWTAPWLLVFYYDSDIFGRFFFAVFTVGIVVAYFQARFSLFLPATAITQPISPSEAWTTSRGYGGLIFWSAFLAGTLGMLLFIPLSVLTVFLLPHSSLVVDVVLVPFNCAAQLVSEALVVGALSFAYRAIQSREHAV